MALRDSTIVLRSLRARLFSSVVTVLTVAVAVGLMLVLLSMRDAGRKAFERGSGNMHLLVSGDSSRLVAILNGVFYADAPARPLQWIQFRRIERMREVDFAVPLTQGDSFRGWPVTATTAEFFSRFSTDPAFDSRTSGGPAWTIAAGRLFERPFEVVVGAEAARETGLGVGDEVHMSHGSNGAHEHDAFGYVVVGVLAPTGTAHDRALFTDLNSTWIIHAHERRQREDPTIETTSVDDLTDGDRLITGIYVRGVTRAGSSASAAVQTLAGRLSRDGSVTVASPTSEIRKLFRIVSNIDQILLAMAGAVMASSGIGIMLALYNSMEQRRRQIAVLRVLGCSAARVIRLVLMEAALLGLFGASAGLVVGGVGAAIAAGVLERRIGIVIEPSVEMITLSAVIVSTVVLAAVAGLVPAVVAYRTGVAKNLRPMG
jgi:putative ABC transport system permease protein